MGVIMDKAALIVWSIISVYIVLCVVVSFLYNWLKKKDRQFANYSDADWNNSKKSKSDRIALKMMNSQFFNSIIGDSVNTLIVIAFFGFALLIIFFFAGALGF